PRAGVSVSVAVLPVRCWTHVFAAPAPTHFPARVEIVPRPLTVIVTVPGGAVLNVAVTELEPVSVRVQVDDAPLHDPPHPRNVAPAVGVATRVTVEPEFRLARQVELPFPQLIPPPLTMPLPVTATLSWRVAPPPPPPALEKVAVTERAAVMITVHVVAVPAHAPPQPRKVEPTVGVAVSTIEAFGVSLTLHRTAPLPQLTPPPETLPLPETETVSAKPVPVVPPVKVAVTSRACVISTVHGVAVPPHAPVQPAKTPPVEGVATSVTVAFWAKFAEQISPPSPQLIAPAPPLTLPLPLTVTFSGTAWVNVATTVRRVSIVTVQLGPAPVHDEPDQPVKM